MSGYEKRALRPMRSFESTHEPLLEEDYAYLFELLMAEELQSSEGRYLEAIAPPGLKRKLKKALGI